MPNRCFTRLTATDLTPEQVERLRQALLSGKFPEEFAPEPDWGAIPDSEGELPRPDVKGELRFPSNAERDERWCDWRRTHWGTKLHAYEVSVDDDDEPGSLGASYITAWNPLNEECVAEISRAFPKAKFCFNYYEPDCGFIGATLAKGGVVVDESTESVVIYEKWYMESVGKIAALQREYDNRDEGDLDNAIYELWREDESGCIEAFHETLIPGLVESLNEELAKKAKVQERFDNVAGDRKMNFTEFFKKRLGEST